MLHTINWISNKGSNVPAVKYQINQNQATSEPFVAIEIQLYLDPLQLNIFPHNVDWLQVDQTLFPTRTLSRIKFGDLSVMSAIFTQNEQPAQDKFPCHILLYSKNLKILCSLISAILVYWKNIHRHGSSAPGCQHSMQQNHPLLHLIH